MNFCGLQYNTRYYIMLRQKIDGSYDVDKNGKLIPANYFAHSSITDTLQLLILMMKMMKAKMEPFLSKFIK